ncbi:unnamed protein product [Didymodactylos carnosus]|uniref:EGF-like domain-containing protein n=1 Tax=Didymodactylos carnosus TaxID=1234261 RepID=A0A8S2NN45_9BILA|nr:unnamed protein product [Didymodactylos carnosus]CAF4010469.1 unnamed protein product [Didymodactylos carnosus]
MEYAVLPDHLDIMYQDCILSPQQYVRLLNNNDTNVEDYLYYCLRVEQDNINIKYDQCFDEINNRKISFKKLKELNITNEELFQWNIPVDLISYYSRYNNDDKFEFICNCSLSSKRYGRYCEYTYGDSSIGLDSFEQLINGYANRMRDLPVNRRSECYPFVTKLCSRCIDWRDICDGEWDCMNGEDEKQCRQVEMNECNFETEYRCRNGLCINRQFLFDGDMDCLDTTDEQKSLADGKHYDYQSCYKTATIDCHEHFCSKDLFSCGDGHCFKWDIRFDLESRCKNRQDSLHVCELKSSWTMKDGRCAYAADDAEFMEFESENDRCLKLIKCALLNVRTVCQPRSIFEFQEQAFRYVIEQCFENNETIYKHSLSAYVLSPFIQTYTLYKQFSYLGHIDLLHRQMAARPGLFCFNGTFTCRGRETIRDLNKEKYCVYYDDIYEKQYPYPPFEYLFCVHKNATTTGDPDYCNDTQNFYLCLLSGECISKYRLLDGFIDCIDQSDENFTLHQNLNTKYLHDKYNCEIKTNAMIMAHFLGDGDKQCPDGTDEMSLRLNWQSFQCQQVNTFACDLLNRYKTQISQILIPFNSLCNSIWDMRNGIDEQECHDWICEDDQLWIKFNNTYNVSSVWNGNCILNEWKCDRDWDYPDGSDERECYSNNLRDEECREKISGFYATCRNKTNQALISIPCEQVGDGIIDCAGGLEERNVFACSDGYPLNNRLLCEETGTCIESMNLCDGILHCPSGIDESIAWCNDGRNVKLNCQPGTFACRIPANDYGPCISLTKRCDSNGDCTPEKSYGWDELFCLPSRDNVKMRYLSSSNSIEEPIIQPGDAMSSFWLCNNGLVVKRHNFLSCLCPPAFYGTFCEFHNHRITIVFMINTSTVMNFSSQKTKIHLTPIIRIGILLEYKNHTIDHFFTIHNFLRQHQLYKRRIYLNYPQSLLKNIRQATANDYKIRFLHYNINDTNIELKSVWEYDIKYPFLPAYRLTTLLTIDIKQRSQFDSSKRCHRIVNKPNEYYCEKILSPCKNDTCNTNSLCFPTFYHTGQYHYFYCLCSLSYYGITCHLQTNKNTCQLCENNATCLAYMNQYYQHVSYCLCQSGYFGDYCKHSMAQLIIQSMSSFIGTAVVQFINPNMKTMILEIKSQQIMVNNVLVFNDFYLPAIGLLKNYSNDGLDSLSALYYSTTSKNISHMNISKITKCFHVHDLNLIPKNYSSISEIIRTLKEYHRPCHQNHSSSLICFYDPQLYYLCFCNSTTYRAICFYYDFNYDRCQFCLNQGQCFIGEKRMNFENFICRCPKCTYGSICQYRTNQFAFSLEILLQNDDYQAKMNDGKMKK